MRGDAAFGNLASFGGSSVAENQYYINGFNITNSFRSLNFAQVPFEAIAEQQVKTGGYGAEFGRSTGGVINQITKRGTNTFHAGANIFWTPENLTDNTRDVYLTDGSLRSDNSQDTEEKMTTSAWASGALIKDRLFAYGLVSYGHNTSDTFFSVASGTNESADVDEPKWLLKMDWNINDSNLLELTAFSDKEKTETAVYRNTPGSLQRGDLIGTNFTEQGGENYILKYTGYLTDKFTLSALYGRGEFSRSQHLLTADGTNVAYAGDIANPATGCPVITDARPSYRRNITGTYVSTCNITGTTIDRTDSGDTRDQFRVDAEWQLGDHLLRFGYDADNYESVAGVSLEGGRTFRYSTSLGADGEPNTGDEVDLVRERVFNQGATVKVEQSAYYLQDSWSITNNFIAYLGVRWDNFKNINGQGQAYVEIKNQFAPRLGFSWDVFGDSSFKVFGNAGRYALPLTPSVAVRGASASIFSQQTFTYTSIDPRTGAPVGMVPTGPIRYLNGEDGNAKNPLTIASKNLKPMYQDEYILGFQKTLSDNFSVGVRGIYRDLKTAIDDNCDYTAVLDANGFTYDPEIGFVDGNGNVAALPSSGFPYCRIFNPGEDAVFVTDLTDSGTLTENTIPGARLIPPAKRSYSALEFFFDGTWDKFFLQGSYTYAKNRGNTEGGVKSDIGQADTSVTQDFDYIELTTDTFGYLPNDRRHSLKMFGNYEISDEWSLGANVLVQSGRPLNCFGVLDRDPDRAPGAPPNPDTYNPHPYGASFQRCNNIPVPRGTAGRLPWTSRFDLSVAYRPAFVEGLQVKMDVFNILNSQKVTSVSEIAEDATTGAPVETYLQPTSFQAPRSVRFLLQYDF